MTTLAPRYRNLNGAPSGIPIAGMELSTLLTTIGSEVSELVVNVDMNVTANTVIPSTLALVVTNGAIITIASGRTLTINGSFQAGRYQVFSQAITSGVVWGGGTVDTVYPEWWGAKTDGVTDCAFAIQCAAYSLGSVSFGAGTYLCSAFELDGMSFHLFGVSGNTSDQNFPRTILKAIGAQTHLIQFRGHHHRGEDIIFDGDYQTTVGVVNFYIPTLLCHFRNCTFQNTARSITASILNLDSTDGGTSGTVQGDSNSFVECQIKQVDGLTTWGIGIRVVGSNAFLNNCERGYISAVRIGVASVSGGTINVRSTQFSGIGLYCVNIAGDSQPMTIEDCYIEDAFGPGFVNMVNQVATSGSHIRIINNTLNNGSQMILNPAMPLYLEGNYFASGNVNITATAATNFSPVLSIKNAFGAATAYTGANFQSVIRLGDIDNINATPVVRNFSLPNVAVYANNAAASAGGLGIGEVYRNGDVLQIVHS
jgi:hypothetical protein